MIDGLRISGGGDLIGVETEELRSSARALGGLADRIEEVRRTLVGALTLLTERTVQVETAARAAADPIPVETATIRALARSLTDLLLGLTVPVGEVWPRNHRLGAGDTGADGGLRGTLIDPEAERAAIEERFRQPARSIPPVPLSFQLVTMRSLERRLDRAAQRFARAEEEAAHQVDRTRRALDAGGSERLTSVTTALAGPGVGLLVAAMVSLPEFREGRAAGRGDSVSGLMRGVAGVVDGIGVGGVLGVLGGGRRASAGCTVGGSMLWPGELPGVGLSLLGGSAVLGSPLALGLGAGLGAGVGGVGVGLGGPGRLSGWLAPGGIGLGGVGPGGLGLLGSRAGAGGERGPGAGRDGGPADPVGRAAGTVIGAGGAFGLFADGPVEVERVASVTQSRASATGTTAELLGAMRDIHPSGGAESGSVGVQRIVHPDGTVGWIVTAPGTQEWSPVTGANPADLTSNLQAMAGTDSAAEQVVLAAMREAGVRPDEPVLMMGHSQGGMVALAAAGSAREEGYAVTGVLTVGSPIGNQRPADDLAVLSVEHTEDIVPGLDGARNPDSGHWVTVRRSLTAVPGTEPGIGESHEIDGYLATADLIDRAGDPAIDAWWNAVEPAIGRQGDEVRVTNSVWRGRREGR